MILPTANGVAKLQSTSQSKAKLDKTQVGAEFLQKMSCFIFRQSSCSKLLTVTAASAITSSVFLEAVQQISPHQTFVLVVWNRFPPQAAQLLQSTPASRSPPVNSAWKKHSSPRQVTSTGSSSTRRWASAVGPLCEHMFPVLSLVFPLIKMSFIHLQMVQAFTHAPATVDGERGGKFRLLDGNVFGEFTELVRLTFSLLNHKIIWIMP